MNNPSCLIYLCNALEPDSATFNCVWSCMTHKHNQIVVRMPIPHPVPKLALYIKPKQEAV